MKIRVSHLPPQGLPVKAELSLEKLNARMNEGCDNDIEFLTSPVVALIVTPTPQGAETRGNITTSYSQPCGRCDLSIEKALTVDAILTLHRKPPPPDGSGVKLAGQSHPHPEEYEDDIGITFFEGDQIDLEELLQELLILKLDRFWSPTCSQHGKCSHCGTIFDKSAKDSAKNLPKDTVSLSELLKKAGVSNN